MPGGSTLRQCTHCLEKISCANRRCTKVEKLKALGYFPLLLWGKYRPQNKKWTAQLQCPFELPVVAHAALEKIVCLFEGLLEACGPEREEVGQQERTGEEDEAEEEIDEEDQRGQGEQCEIGETGRRDMQEIEIEAQEERVESERVEKGEMEGQNELGGMETEEMEEDKEKEQTEEAEKKEIEAKKKVVAASRKSAVKISAKKKSSKRVQNTDDACPYHSTMDIFPVQYVSKTHEKKGCKEVLVHWLPCPSCQKTWPPSWEPQENIGMTVS